MINLDPSKNHFDGPVVLTDGNGASRPGYRVNATPAALAETPGLAAFSVEPTAPARVYAGDTGPDFQTVFLLFADETEARANIPSVYWVGDAAS